MRVGRCQASPYGHLLFQFLIRPLGQVVKTPPFHGGNTGSSPVGVTKVIFTLLNITSIIWRISSAGRASALQAEGRRFDPVILHQSFFTIVKINFNISRSENNLQVLTFLLSRGGAVW